MMEHYLTISNKSENIFIVNTCNNFKVKLNKDLDLTIGIWKVALTKISYPFNWNNLDEEANATITIYHNVKDKHIKKGRGFNEDELDFLKVIYSQKMNFNDRYVKTQFEVQAGYYENAAEIGNCILRDFYDTNIGTEYDELTIDAANSHNGQRVSFRGQDAILFTNATKLV